MVNLPEFARLLLARQGPNGRLAHMGITALVDSDGFNPNSRQVVTLSPATNRYAVVVYHVSYGQTPMDAFSVTIQHDGDYLFTGRLTEEDISDGLDLWAPILQSLPMTIDVSNDDLVAYNIFRIRLHYLVFNIQADWLAAQAILQAYPNAGVLP